MRSTTTRQRGLGLVDALLALLVLTVGLLAVLRLQPELRRHAEVARQRSEALRLAQADLERARAAPAALAADDRIVDAATLGTRYRLLREVDALAWPNTVAVTVSVQWQAPDGAAQQLRLAGMLGTLDPALAALAVLPR